MKNQSILVVDDDPGTLELLTHILKMKGYHVITTTNGKSVVTLLEKHSPDLIILDIVMPELDGFQTLSLIRQRSNLPVIMLTGRSEVTTLRDALALGADDYVKKPFRTRELLARIKSKLRLTVSKDTPPLILITSKTAKQAQF